MGDTGIHAAGEGGMSEAKCHDCQRPYGEPGFHDLVVPNDVWRRISPTKDEGGLLCPSCLLARLEVAGIECVGALMSGPLRTISAGLMHTIRLEENSREGSGEQEKTDG